jgi:hypothetical protein
METFLDFKVSKSKYLFTYVSSRSKSKSQFKNDYLCRKFQTTLNESNRTFSYITY